MMEVIQLIQVELPEKSGGEDSLTQVVHNIDTIL